MAISADVSAPARSSNADSVSIANPTRSPATSTPESPESSRQIPAVAGTSAVSSQYRRPARASRSSSAPS